MDDGSDDDGEILGFERRKALLAVGLAILLTAGTFGLIGEFAVNTLTGRPARALAVYDGR